MLEWKKLYEIKGKNNKLVGCFFEELALAYLSSTYKQYSWKATRSSWDGNRDFTTLVLDNIWGEAKYKKDSSALRRQDVDPTMLSGFLDGKVKLVFIITNGTIPQTINSRMNEIARRCGFKVVGITQTQLEYWLIIHPKEYKRFFDEDLCISHPQKAVSIENIRLSHRLDNHFENSYIESEFICDDIYNLSITLSCNVKERITIIEQSTYPIAFLEEPSICLYPGLHQFQFVVKLIRENAEPVILKLQLDDGTILSYALHVKIVCNKNPKLVYSQQEQIKLDIFNAMKNLPEGDFNHCIALHGELGYGKTFLMRELAKDLSNSYVVHVIQCVYVYYKGANCMKLCQIIMFINYGFFFEKNSIENRNSLNYYKHLLTKNNSEKIISDELLEDIIDGCFDPLIARKTIADLSQNASTRIIKYSRFARRHILFIDDVHLFQDEEVSVFNMILTQMQNSYNNCVLIFSKEDSSSEHLDILSYKLEGLKTGDIIESLKINILESNFYMFKSQVANMPKQPQMLSELLLFIGRNSNSTLLVENVNEYIIQINNNRLTNQKYNIAEGEKRIIDILYHFQYGISKKLLSSINVSAELLDSLYLRGYLLCYNQRYIPCCDYFYYSYLNRNNKIVPNKETANILSQLLRFSEIDPLFDIIQAQALLIQYDKDTYLKLKENFKAKIRKYIDKGFYKRAMLYGNIFCFDTLKKAPVNQGSLEALFYYGIALIHCDSQRRAIEIFTFIKNNTKSNELLYFRASAELINNNYSRFRLEGLLQEAIVLKHDMFSQIQRINDENTLAAYQLRIAYSTCMNRIMMIYFLLGKYFDAQKIFDEYRQYHSNLPACMYSEKYNSMYFEWKMDYARGIEIRMPKKALEWNKTCYDNFSSYIDFRRKLLCKIDCIFLEAIQKGNYNQAITELYILQEQLRSKGIVSETVKVSIRIAYCYLMKYATINEFKDLSDLKPFVEKIYTELFSMQLETHLLAQGRIAYLLNNLLALISIIKDDLKTASEILRQNLQLIQYCEGEYLKISKHNFSNIKSITKVDWYFHSKKMYSNTYYLDIRIW